VEAGCDRQTWCWAALDLSRQDMVDKLADAACWEKPTTVHLGYTAKRFVEGCDAEAADLDLDNTAEH
jgi:hypothetical protein